MVDATLAAREGQRPQGAIVRRTDGLKVEGDEADVGMAAAQLSTCSMLMMWAFCLAMLFAFREGRGQHARVELAHRLKADGFIAFEGNHLDAWDLWPALEGNQ